MNRRDRRTSAAQERRISTLSLQAQFQFQEDILWGALYVFEQQVRREEPDLDDEEVARRMAQRIAGGLETIRTADEESLAASKRTCEAFLPAYAEEHRKLCPHCRAGRSHDA
jgi:hypothetical protein